MRECKGTLSRRRFLATSAAALGTMGWARSAWGAEAAKAVPAATTGPVPKCLIRVEWLGKQGAAAAEAASLSKALAGTAAQLGVALDDGTGGTADGLLVVALDGRKNEALAAAKAGPAPAVVLCPGGPRPAPDDVWQLGESRAGLLVGASKVEKDAVYGLRMLHAAWKMKGGKARIAGVSPSAGLNQVLQDKAAMEEAEAVADEYMKEAVEIRRSKWSDLIKASLVYVSLRRLMEANQYDGIALQNCMSCYHAAGTNPCIAAMRLLDEGLPAACEGDMGALRIQLMTHWLFGRPSFIGEGQPTLWNTRISAHCTSPSKLRGYDRPHVPFLLMDHSESGRGVAPQVKWEVGHPVTFFNPLDGGWRGAKLGTGHVVSNSEQPPNGGCRTTVEFTLDGVASVSGCHVHHNMLVYGNVEREVDAFYTLLYGTTPEKFRDLDASKPASRAERASQVPSCLCCRQAHGPRA